MSFELRLARPVDNASSVELMRELYAHFEDLHFDEEHSVVAMRELIADAALGRVFLIVVEGVAVGYAAVCFGYNLELLGRTAWLDEFYIREAFRGQGIGSQILAQLEQKCREEGFKALMLELDKTNDHGLRLYKRAGFVARDVYQVYVKTL